VPEPHDSPSDPAEPAVVHGEWVPEARPLPAATGAGTAEVGQLGAPGLPATVAAATGGFVLGVGAFMLMKLLRRPAAARSMTRRRRKLLAGRRGGDVVDTHSFLIDVHLLKR
jgi:hypothetical protein